ncbi:YncE family protein [Actinoplanes sp. L3-i22]|uniref:YncE family protein n=1 Tax=Actinoplanes sp. L3-i22 TaxID=2836373 RepID=UPI001C77677F|nr:hypothetical protein [Actinoplanes sp. L3-i22]BCY13038.1 hypothetical protein L3i22_081260 [Actinoplanes sp. L3-i22]
MRCQVLIGSVLVAGALAVPAAAQADPASTSPIRHALPTTETATDVLTVGSEVWIAAGNSVLITSPTGQVHKTVTGLFGAKGLTPSADGDTVYVSESSANKIAQVSAAGEVLDSWTSQGCPGKSSVVDDALYYAYTCGDSSGGVGRLDLTDHTDKSVLADSSIDAVTAAGSHLVAYATDSTAGMTGYTIGDDGLLTKVAQVEFGQFVYDAEMSADGSQVIATDYSNGYGVARYDTTTMTLAGRFTTGAYPDAVAWAPDEKRFAGILNAMYDARAVHIFDASTGETVVRAEPAGTTSYRSLAHEASWSADGSTIYSLAQDGPATTAYLVATPTAGQVKTTVSVTVAAAKAYGKNLTITVRAPQRPKAAVSVAVTQAGATTTRKATTNTSGVATVTVPARGNGTVTATTSADATYLASSGTATFKTPSLMSVTMLRGTSKKGVVHYKSVSAVLAAFRVLPARAAKVTVTLQHKSGKSWKSDGAGVITAESDGILGIVMKRGTKKVLFRFVARAAADSSGGASPSITSPSFVVD